MHRADIIVLTPPAWIDSALAIAGCRSGAKACLDIEYATEQQASEQLRRLERYAPTPYGIKIGPESASFLDALLAEFPPDRLDWVCLTGGAGDDLKPCIDGLKGRGRRVLLEAVSLAEAQLGELLGVDGLILKGHEAGGRVGAETSFILLQRWGAHLERGGNADLPVYVQGGVGPNTAAACVAGGATGVVLDAQLLLTRESSIPEEIRHRLAAFDGTETSCPGERLGAPYRVLSRPGLTAPLRAAREEERLVAGSSDEDQRRRDWRREIHGLTVIGPEQGLWPLGQDATLARPLGERYRTVGGIIAAVVEQVEQNLAAARRMKPLSEGSPLARRHGTRYPILQGPMTRVSDTPEFADAVASGGALPFLALALLRQAETETLLRETRDRLGPKSWGVGILGFVPAEIRKEQLAAIRVYRPPFALIAGGRPDQARELENEGIPTYLHVPSPGLLRAFLRDGARRFVFEGRECGGHVGPRTSFVLWETMIDVLREHLDSGVRGEELSIVFAGGIHDARSAAMLTALAAPLAARGVAIGALLGTAYLFTREAVEGRAITPRFQQEALRCNDTVLLETAPGHAIRCAPSPYRDDFERERARLKAEGRSAEEVARALELRNIGRLRIASKGLDRTSNGPGGSRLAEIPEEEQYARGMYMIGQLASLRDEIISIEALHDDVCGKGTRVMEELVPETTLYLEPHPEPCDVAIVGMACYYPKASGLADYWQNILDRVQAVTEIPETHWDWRLYYDPNPRARDKIISKWGGFLDDVPFDPLTFGITPNSLLSIEPLQLFLLEATRRALADAGYSDRPFPRERTASILGIGGGGSPLAVQYGFRTCLPLLETVPGLEFDSDELLEKCRPLMPEWTEDSFPGILFNVAVGRIANRFNLAGPNYAIDAACGSSLAAVYACVRELQVGTSDVAIALGADTVQTPYAYMAFSKTHALSPKGRCRPFDAEADGIVLSEGVGAVILKRLADAERDGDRIYAVIKGMGASSDGRDKGLTAPRLEGQLRALRRAYAQARVSPGQVGLIEAHGTGTVVGDQTEAQALIQFMREAQAGPQSCAVGSVKSMIGHTKCAAGIAGLIKTSLALHHRVLPPTLVETPNPKGDFEEGVLYLNTEPRPWVHGATHPRYAGVSAFGFGGTNFHAVLTEYNGDYLDDESTASPRWPAELVVFSGPDREAVRSAVNRCLESLEAGARPALADLAAASWKAYAPSPDLPILTVVAASLDDLREKLRDASGRLAQPADRWHDPRGLEFAERPGDAGGAVAFLFPGQGAQYPNMLAQVALTFPEVRRVLDRAEAVLAGSLERPLARFLYPGSAFRPEAERANQEAITRADVAQPAIGAVSLGLSRLLESLGIEPQFLAGHSYGEYVALCAAGVMDDEDLFRLSHRRGAILREKTALMPGGMAALDTDADTATTILADQNGISVANSNAPNQTVIAGPEDRLDAVLARCRERGVRGQRLPVSCAFHSPLVAPAREPLAQALAQVRLQPPRRPVYSNVTADRYNADPAAILGTLVDHLTSRVRFCEQVEAMYEAGARIFVEVGPKGALTGLVGQILRDRPHLAIASDFPGRPGLVQLLQLIGRLAAHGVAVSPSRLFRGRDVATIDLDRLSPETGRPKLSPTTWIINSVRNRAIGAPEPRLLGQVKEIEKRASASSREPTSPARSEPATEPTSAPLKRTHVVSTNGKPQGTPASYHPPARMPSASSASDAAQVMLRYQDLMERFLETQRSLMSSYLQGLDHPESGLLLPLPKLEETNGHLTTPIVAPAIPAPEAPPAETPVAGSKSPSGAIQAPPDPAHAPADPPNASAERYDRGRLTDRLLGLVSQRTGYPKDMLGLDVDLEADLGIDSIKRIEILSEITTDLGTDVQSMATGLEMEKLTVIRTLRGIIDYLDAALSSPPNPDPSGALAVPSDKTPKRSEGQDSVWGEVLPVQRALVELVDCPVDATADSLLTEGVVLFTDDGRGIARSMADQLADLGQRTVFLGTSDDPASGSDPDAFTADLTNPEAVADVLRRVREEHGTISGLIYLAPLADVAEGEAWDHRAWRDVKALYLLARALGDDLRQSGREGKAFLLAATALGGGFGFGFEAEDTPDAMPGHGGVLGFVKCLAQEWPEVLVRGVDLDTGDVPGDLAETLLRELCCREGPVEVGYLGRRRITWEPRASALPPDDDAPVPFEPGEPVLITGGARGITAAIAAELARRFRPTLLIVGRSELPPEQEPAETASLSTPESIKAAIIARMQREGRPPAPGPVEAEYRRLRQAREIRDNLAQMTEAGAVVHYYSADVRDEAEFGGLLDQLQTRFGPLAGVIHGAGVIEDRLVKDKTPESFDRIFQTKVQGARILTERLNPAQLKVCSFFASVASRFGNKGQSDYAAANEVLSKLALLLDRRWDARVFSVAWGPWSEIGMVADLEAHLVRRGLRLISPQEGPALFVAELLHGRKGESEIILAGGAEALARPNHPAATLSR
jgi:acyl transferase domain-containing protein/NAD(P)H-dependent flavin oxidoreductase YrpB (nitropropane dioxygenase family)/NAD(P)-dependent dehydrogenase (short-subunit alcohol dehydrogenase family)